MSRLLMFGRHTLRPTGRHSYVSLLVIYFGELRVSTHNNYAYFQAFPRKSRLLMVRRHTLGSTGRHSYSYASTLVVCIFGNFRVFTPENYSRFQASLLTSRLLTLGRHTLGPTGRHSYVSILVIYLVPANVQTAHTWAPYLRANRAT